MVLGQGTFDVVGELEFIQLELPFWIVMSSETPPCLPCASQAANKTRAPSGISARKAEVQVSKCPQVMPSNLIAQDSLTLVSVPVELN